MRLCRSENQLSLVVDGNVLEQRINFSGPYGKKGSLLLTTSIQAHPVLASSSPLSKTIAVTTATEPTVKSWLLVSLAFKNPKNQNENTGTRAKDATPFKNNVPNQGNTGKNRKGINLQQPSPTPATHLLTFLSLPLHPLSTFHPQIRGQNILHPTKLNTTA